MKTNGTPGEFSPVVPTPPKESESIRVIEGKGLFVPGTACGQNLNWFVDTGCSITILSKKIFDLIPNSQRPTLTSFDTPLKSANDRLIESFGQAEFSIHLGDQQVTHRVVVADVTSDGLIGLDLMIAHRMVIDVANKKVWCDGENVPVSCQNVTTRACRVAVAEHTVIPASSRTLITAKVQKPLAAGTWIIEPLNRTPGGQPIVLGKVLVRVSGKNLPVELINPTERDVTLYKHTNLGIASPVKDDQIVGTIQTSEVNEVVAGVDSNNKPDVNQKLDPELEKILNGIDVDLSGPQLTQVEQLLHRNSSVFATSGQPLGRTELVQHDIVTLNDQPIKQRVRRTPFHLQKEAKAEVEKMLDSGVIEPSCSPWASPVVLVRKKDGTLRYCIDYRKLNAVTQKDSYPLPRIDESLDALGRAQYFSTLDLASGYWQIGLSEDAKQKSAFCTASGLFQFNVMPFGLTNAPATFQRLMERVLAGLHWSIALVYIDDIIIFSQTFEDHLKDLEEVLYRLKTAGLKLKPKKCCLFRKQVQYLGHIVSSQGVATDESKISAVRDWATPTNVSELRSFLGICSYYRKFVPDFATVSKPLTKLTEKGVLFNFDKDAEQAFRELKRRLITAPILAFPERDATFILDTDASDVGLGAVLSQEIDGMERVVAYGSRLLTKPERKYCVTRKELLAVVHAVNSYRHYLYGRHFILRTDHSSLRWLRSFKDPEGQLARWLEVLDTFDFEIQHRPGRLHLNADALSRGPCTQCHQEGHEGEKIHRGRHKSVKTEAKSAERESEPVQPVRTRSKAQPANVDPHTNWLSGTPLDPDAIKTAQSADPILAEVATWISRGHRPDYQQIAHHGAQLKFLWGQFDSLRQVGGILVRDVNLPNLTSRRQVLIPPTLKDDCLRQCHDTVTAGHFGIAKTLANVKRRFLWHGMRADVELYVRQCDTCAKYKTSGKKRKAMVQDHRVGMPMERITMDIVGPFPASDSGNRYVLVVVDCFTKWLEAYPLPNQEASTIARVIATNFVSRHGSPYFIHSDQGPNFESNLFAQVCDLLDIKKTRTTPFHPQSDGQSERMIKTLTTMIAQSCQDQQDWDVYLDLLVGAYRATPHATTGFSPNFLVYGRELSMPVDIMIGPSPDGAIRCDEHVTKIKERLEYAYELCRKHLKRGAERQARLYSPKVHGNKFNIGDKVWMMEKRRKKGVSPKLQPKWRGPCLVTKVHGSVVVEVQLSAKKSSVLHTDLLKPCLSQKLPGWMRRMLKRLERNPAVGG